MSDAAGPRDDTRKEYSETAYMPGILDTTIQNCVRKIDRCASSDGTWEGNAEQAEKWARVLAVLVGLRESL